MSEDNKSIEEIIAISYFDTDNIDIKKHIERYFEIKRNIVDVLNKYNIMWTVTDTNSFNNKDKEIERLNKIRQQVIDELFELKDMIYKPKTREINFDVQRKISSMIVKLGSDKE